MMFTLELVLKPEIAYAGTPSMEANLVKNEVMRNSIQSASEMLDALQYGCGPLMFRNIYCFFLWFQN